MSSMKWIGVAAVVTALVVFGTKVSADVTISNDPTQNMVCGKRICASTAESANLNASELATLLASGDVKVVAAAGATAIQVEAPLSWTSYHRLILNSLTAIGIHAPVVVAGPGAVTITLDKARGDGEFFTEGKGHIEFWDLSSSLIIDRIPYTLVGDIKSLASAIAANTYGYFALAKSYDASQERAYGVSPIYTPFYGTFDGLGNAVSNFTLRPANNDSIGFFKEVDGTIRNFGVQNAKLKGYMVASGGLLAALNQGTIARSWASGEINLVDATAVGGLVGTNDGTIGYSFTKVDLRTALGGDAGGLVGVNGGPISESYSTGTLLQMKSIRGGESEIGGLVGSNGNSSITNSFTLSKIVFQGEDTCCATYDFGGLAGDNGHGELVNSYSAGGMSVHNHFFDVRTGGLIGDDENSDFSDSQNAYWDLDKGIKNPNQGAGNAKDDPGLTGLPDEQLKSGLPEGFDPSVWAENPGINHGYPYLIANPPQ